MSASSVGPDNHKIKLVGIGDTADIQVALNNIVYGTNSTPATVGDIGTDSLYGNLATKVSPTFTGTVTATGTVVLPTDTTIGSVSGTEISYLDRAASNIQDQINNFTISDPFWFGSGLDGDVTISSGTTTLTRDMVYNNLTLSGTARLNPAGFRIFVKGTLDLSNAPAGAIANVANNGGNGSQGVAGTGGAGSSSTTSYYGRSSSGGNGAIGANSYTAGTPSIAGTAVSPIFYSNWIQSAGGAARNQGAVIVTTASATAITWRRAFVDLYAPFISGTLYCGAGGNGGNGGSGLSPFYTTGGAGGGGGAGNTGAFIYAKNIKVGASTADSAISFVGGIGGNGGGADENGGGGGGGQGGIVYIVYKSKEGTMTSGRYLINTSGGTGGTGYRGGQGGASGSIALTNLGVGTITIYSATAGSVSGTSAGGTAASNKQNLA